MFNTKEYLKTCKRPIYRERKLRNEFDFNLIYVEYIRELKSLGFSLHKLSQLIGLNDNMLNRILRGDFDKPLKSIHVFRIGLITGHHFDFGRYTYLMPSKDDLIKELETLQPTKKHNKNK